MERREFIQSSCTLCLALNAGLLSLSQLSCAPYAVYDAPVRNDRAYIPADLIATPDVHIVRPAHFAYDIAVQKQKDGSLLALLLRCTHANNELEFEGNQYYCTLHGSTFNLQGGATHGPAQRPLKRLSIRAVSDGFEIDLA